MYIPSFASCRENVYNLKLWTGIMCRKEWRWIVSGPDGRLLPHPSSTAYIFSFDTNRQSATQLSSNCTSLWNSLLCYYTCNSAPPSWYYKI